MIARLIETSNGQLQLLCANGSISIPTLNNGVLGNLLSDFKISEEIQGTDGFWKKEYPDMAMVPGTTIAYVTDAKQLVIEDFLPFKDLLDFPHIKFISTQEFAKKYNKSAEIVKVYCRQGRILGAKKVGTSWVIPDTSPYPIPQEFQRDASPRAGRPPKYKIPRK